VWEQTTGLLHLVSVRQNGGEQTCEDEYDSQHFDRVSFPAFYRGLLAGPAPNEEKEEGEGESRLDVDYRGFAAPRLPDTVSIARTILR